MNYGYTKPTRGKRIAAWVIAILAGLIHPYMLTIQVMLPIPLPFFLPVMLCVVYAMAGLAPTVAGVVAATATTFLALGLKLGFAAALPTLFLGVFAVWQIRSGRDFFDQLKRAVAFSLAAGIAMFALLGLFFGTDLIKQAFDFMRTLFDENMEYFRSMTALYANVDSAAIPLDEFKSLYLEAFAVLEQYYNTHLIADMLTGSVLTAIIGIFWGNYILARAGRATTQTFRGLTQWYLPNETTIGLLLVLVLAYVLQYTSLKGTAQLWMIVSQLGKLAFIVQLLASLNRALLKKGRSVGRRTFLTVLYILLIALGRGALFGVDIATIFALFGVLSALFGSKGVFPITLNKSEN